MSDEAKSPTIYAQLARAQAQFKSAIKDSDNPHFRSKYADLASIWEACREGLAAEGLFVSQPIERVENVWQIRTRIYNADGQCVECAIPVFSEKQTPQAFGSAITYARRYSLAAILGIVTDDDDAEGAMGRDKQQAQAVAQPVHKPKLSKAKLDEYLAYIDKGGRLSLQKLSDKWEVDEFDLDLLGRALEDKRAQQAGQEVPA